MVLHLPSLLSFLVVPYIRRSDEGFPDKGDVSFVQELEREKRSAINVKWLTSSAHAPQAGGGG